MSGLERRYRLLLRVLPGWYRAVWEQDMVATFLAGVEAEVAGDEQADLVGEYGWPDRAEVVSVLALAVRLRLGGAPAHAQSGAWGAAARRVVLVVLLIHAVWSVLTVGLAVHYTLAVPASPSAPPDSVDPLSLGEWVLFLAGLVWLAAYLALLAGHPHATGGLAAVGLAQLAVLRVQDVLLTHAPIEGAAAAAASVVVPALLLLGLAAFHWDAPLPRPRPWLTALGVGLVLGSALQVLMAFQPNPVVWWAFLHPDAVSCMLVVVAGTVCLAARAVRPGGGPAWPLALAVLAAAALTLRLTSLWALTEADWLASRTAGLVQVAATLATAMALTVAGARDLRRLPVTHHPEPPLQY